MKNTKVAEWDSLEPLAPAYALVANVDLVVIRWPGEEDASVLYGRCLHRGALLAEHILYGRDHRPYLTHFIATVEKRPGTSRSRPRSRSISPIRHE